MPSLEYHELIEWNHRLFATLGRLLMIVTVGATLLWFRRPRRLLGLALLAAATYIAQAVLGGITVLLHLDQTWVAAHMGNSMLLLAVGDPAGPVCANRGSGIGGRGQPDSTARSANPDLQPPTPSPRPRSALRVPHPPHGWRWAPLLWTYVALFTGSAVVGAQADLACPAWPQCADDHLLPTTFDEWINFGHRIAVGFSDVLMLVLAIAIWRTAAAGSPAADHQRMCWPRST